MHEDVIVTTTCLTSALCRSSCRSTFRGFDLSTKAVEAKPLVRSLLIPRKIQGCLSSHGEECLRSSLHPLDLLSSLDDIRFATSLLKHLC
jgi:hypothetical protein